MGNGRWGLVDGIETYPDMASICPCPSLSRANKDTFPPRSPLPFFFPFLFDLAISCHVLDMTGVRRG